MGLPELDELLHTTSPMPLTDDEVDLLVDYANRRLNDYYHQDQCNCDKWPTGCVSSAHYFPGSWDTNAFAIVLKDLFGAWARINSRHLSGLALLNPGVSLITNKGLALGEVAQVNDNLRNSINEAIDGIQSVLDTLRNA